MIKLSIPDMSCGHCAGVITKALKGLDPDTTVQFNMPAHTADVTTIEKLDVVVETLAAAGYPATVAA